jgi:hypothetical protein
VHRASRKARRIWMRGGRNMVHGMKYAQA